MAGRADSSERSASLRPPTKQTEALSPKRSALAKTAPGRRKKSWGRGEALHSGEVGKGERFVPARFFLAKRFGLMSRAGAIAVAIVPRGKRFGWRASVFHSADAGHWLLLHSKCFRQGKALQSHRAFSEEALRSSEALCSGKAGKDEALPLQCAIEPKCFGLIRERFYLQRLGITKWWGRRRLATPLRCDVGHWPHRALLTKCFALPAPIEINTFPSCSVPL